MTFAITSQHTWNHKKLFYFYNDYMTVCGELIVKFYNIQKILQVYALILF